MERDQITLQESEPRKLPGPNPLLNLSLTVINLFLSFKNIGDFPGGPVVRNPPYNAGDVGSIPGQGTKIPHAVGQLSLRATTTELARLN